MAEELQEIMFNSSDKDVKINQQDFQQQKSAFLKAPLPFTIPAIKDGQPIDIAVTALRPSANATNINLIHQDQIVGRLYLAKPDIFPAAYYVDSMALVPHYQGMGIAGKLYHALIHHMRISLIGIDQSLGARKMWVALSRKPENVLYAVMPSRDQGNLFYPCKAQGDSGYQYVKYNGLVGTMKDGSNLYVILTAKSGTMAKFIRTHIKLMRLKYDLSKQRQTHDPLGSHVDTLSTNSV